MEGLQLASSRELALRRTFPSSAGVARALGLEPLIPHRFPRPSDIDMAATARSINKSTSGTNCNLRSVQSGGLQTPFSGQLSYRSPSRRHLANSAGVMSNQVHLRRLTQIQRHLESKPWTATRTISMSSASGGTPPQESFIREFIVKVIQFIASLLPSKALVQKVEEEVDVVTEEVRQGVKVVIEVADEVESMSHTAEMNAEEVEKLAHKVEQITDEVKKFVDDVTDVLEGEKDASSLVDTYQNLKDASDIAAAVVATGEKVAAKPPLAADDSSAATTTTFIH